MPLPCSPEDWYKLTEGRHLFVLFSGGKDSATALAYSKDIFDRLRSGVSLTALYVNTTVGIPETQEYVENFCKLVGVTLQTLNPRKDYFTLARKWGVPRPRARWCCFHLKIEPIKDYLRQVSSSLVLDGMRRSESRKRSKYPLLYDHSHFGLVMHPIIEWSDAEVDEYLAKKGLPVNPCYALGFSSWECWCGVCKRPSEFRELKANYPEFFAKLLELEGDMRTGFAYAFHNGKPFYLRDL